MANSGDIQDDENEVVNPRRRDRRVRYEETRPGVSTPLLDGSYAMGPSLADPRKVPPCSVLTTPDGARFTKQETGEWVSQ